MSAKKCLICNRSFTGRADALTCSPRCRKRLQLVRTRLQTVTSGVSGHGQIKIAAERAAVTRRHQHGQGKTWKKGLAVVLVGLFGLLGLALSVAPQQAAAASTSSDLNFQARLLDKGGAVVPDGNYNIEFKIYNSASGGAASPGSCPGSTACLWMEDYTVANSTAVQVVNGYLSVNLGSVNPFTDSNGPIDWDQQLWLSMDIGGTGSSPSWDGEMTNGGNRIALTALPYSFIAGQLALTSGTNRGTLAFSTVANNPAITLPDASGTVCLDNSSACGFLTGSSANGSYIQLQGSTPGTPQVGNLNINGSGIVGTLVATSGVYTGGSASGDERIDASGNLENINNISGAGTIQLSGTGSSYIMGALGLGTTNPQTGSALTLANDTWVTAVDAAGTGYINLFKGNSQDQIQLGAALAIDGGIVLPTDAGQVTFSDLPIDSSASAGTKESYTMRVGSTNALTVYGEADGSGGVQNIRIAVGSSITPAYTLDVGGDVNISSGSVYRVDGTPGSTTDCTAGNKVLSGITVSGGVITGGACAVNGGGVAPTLTQVYNNGAAAADETANLNSTNGGIVIKDASTTVGNLFTVQNNAANVNYFNVTDAGISLNPNGTGNTGVVIKPSNDTDAAFQVQNPSSVNVLTVDTKDEWVAVGPAAVPANAVLTVGTNTANPDGGIYFGTDTDLYRSGAGALTTDGTLHLDGSTSVIGINNLSAATNVGFSANVSGDSFTRFQIQGSGQLNWGPGNTASDTNLYRAGSGILQTDGNLSLNATGSSTTSPRTISFANTGSGTATALQLDSADGLQAANGKAPQLYSYYGLQIMGGRFASGAPAFTAPLTAGLTVLNTYASYTALVVQGAASQSGDLLDVQTSTPANVFSISATGATLLQNASDSTAAFEVEDQHSSSSVLRVDTTNDKVFIGTGEYSDLFNVGNNLATGGNFIAQDTDATQTTIGYVGSGNSGIAFGSGSDALLYRASTGQLVVKPSSGNDSTAAFQVQPAGSSTATLDVDTTNTRIGIGVSTPTATFQINAPSASTANLFELEKGGSDKFVIDQYGSALNYSNFFVNPSLPDATGGYGQFTLGKANSFSGSSNGTYFAIGVATSFSGNIMDVQQNGSNRLLLDNAGNLSLGGTVNAAGYKVSGTAGVTQGACSAGQIFAPATTGGIVTGGSCVVNGAGATTSLAQAYGNGTTAANQTLALSTANGGGLVIKDAATTVGNLFTVQNNAANVNYFNITSSGISVTGTATVSGAINANGGISVASGQNITFAGTTGNFNQSASSGTFSTGTGAVSLNGNTTIASGKTFSQSGSGIFSTGSGTNTLNGNTTVSGTKTFTVNGGLSTLNGGLTATGTTSINASGSANTSIGAGSTGTVTVGNSSTGAIGIQSGSTVQIQAASGITLTSNVSASANIDVSGSLATKSGADYATTGTSNNVNFGNVSLARLTGASAQTITGIAGGRNGYQLTIINAGTTTATLKNDDTTDSSAANVIITGTGSDMSLLSGASINLVYDGTSDVWRIVGSTSTIGGGTYLNKNATDTSSAAVTAGNYLYSFTNSSSSVSSGVLSLNNGNNTGTVLNVQGTSTTAFQVQNAGGGSLLNVDSLNSNITIAGLDSGGLGAWQTDTANPLPVALYGPASVVANGYVYSLGGENSSAAAVSAVYYAKLNADGSVGAWQTDTANPLPVPLEEETSVVNDGYIYAIGGSTTGGTAVDTVYYAKLNADGSVGAWQTDTANPLPEPQFMHSSVVANGYVYVIEGESGTNKIYYAKLNADGSVGAWATNSTSPSSATQQQAAVAANGYMYIVGGWTSAFYNNIAYAQINSDGSVGSFTNISNPFPTGLREPTAVVSNGYLYALGGYNGSYLSSVYYGKLNASNGSVGAMTATNSMPTNAYGHTSVVSNGYIYEIGGYNGSYLNNVNYVSTSRVQIGANLDLVGLQGGDLADNGSGSFGSVGGSLTAGNGTFVGNLQVQGQGSFAQSLATAGNLSVGGQATFQGNNNSTTAVQIQNSAGATLFNADTTNNQISISDSGGSAYDDEFNSGITPSSKWTLSTGGNGTTAAISGGNLVFTPGTSKEDCWTTETDCTRLLENSPSPTANMQIDVEAMTEPTATSSYVGLIVWQDSTDFMRFELDGNGSSTVAINHDIFKVGGTQYSFPSQMSYNAAAAPAWLRVIRNGTVWTFEYSKNGVDFFTVGSLDTSSGTYGDPGFQANQIGLIMGQAAGASWTGNLPAFNYFRVEQPVLSITGNTRLQSSSNGDLLQANDSGGDSILSINEHDTAWYLDYSGVAIFHGGSNTNALQVQDKNGNTDFNVDTTTNSGEVSIHLSTVTATEHLCSTITNGSAGLAVIRDCSGSPGDYAEDYGTTDPSISAGDLVAIDPTKPAQDYTDSNGYKGSKAWVVKATNTNADEIIGVVSTQPNDVIGEDFTPADNPRPVSLSGRVPVKVNTQNGPIEPGDYLVPSSTPGVAMKATGSGWSIGMALSGYDGAGAGTVIVSTGRVWYVPPTVLQGGSGLTSLDELQVSGPLEVDGNAVFQADITVAGHIIGNSDTSGTLTIGSGATTVTYTFAKSYSAAPHVVVTPESDLNARYWITKSANNFTIHVSSAQSANVTFDYFVQQ